MSNYGNRINREDIARLSFFLGGDDETAKVAMKVKLPADWRSPKFACINGGQSEAVLNKLVKLTGETDPEEAIMAFLRGEYVLHESPCKWREENDVIYLSVVSDGTTGPEWIERLEGKKYNLSKWAKDLLRSSDFMSTTGVKYELAVLKGKLFEESKRVTEEIRDEAKRRGLSTPNAEVACLIREKFSDKEIEEMGLWWIVTMHKPIRDSDGDLCLLDASYGSPDFRWGRSSGFVFTVPQVS